MPNAKSAKKLLLKGKAASQGRVKGKAKLIFNLKDVGKFQNGDILVTKMTEPSMVTVMIKAAAIVTDIGGITSHAAIISRELGIPCVVATKQATKILKDEMIIEVDGIKGEVFDAS